MNKSYYPEIKALKQENSSLSGFDIYYLGFFSHFVPTSTLQDIFTHIQKIVSLYKSEYLTEQEKVKSFVRILAKKMDFPVLESLVPNTWQAGDNKEFLSEYFRQMAEIIPNYPRVTELELFFIGQFHAIYASYQIKDLLELVNNTNETLGNSQEDFETHLDFLVKIFNQKIEENNNRPGSLKLPNPEGVQNSAQSPHNSNRLERKRRMDSSETDQEASGKQMKKTTEQQSQANGHRNGAQSNYQARRSDTGNSENPFEDLRPAHKEVKESRPTRVEQQKTNNNDLIAEVPLDDSDLLALTNISNKGLNGIRRMASKEEEELSRALIEKLQQEEEKEREKAKQSREQQNSANCAICLDDLYSTAFKPLEGCSHVFHEECMKEYLKSKIDEKGFPIVCPEIECKSEITIGDVGDFMDQSYQDKFTSFSFKSYLEKHANEVSCCPTADCSFAFIKEDNQVELKCPVCKKHYCLNCRVVWHKGETCKEYQISHTKDANDVKFEEFVKGQQFKQCPKCGFWVSRTEGCNAMICRCKTQFCYNCGKEGDGHVCPCLQQMRPQPLIQPLIQPPAGLFARPIQPAQPLFNNNNVWGGGGGGGLFNNNNIWRPQPNPNIYGPGNLFANNALGVNPVFNRPVGGLFGGPNPLPHLGNRGGLFGNLLNPYVNNYNDDDEEDDEDYSGGSDNGSNASDQSWSRVMRQKKKKKKKTNGTRKKKNKA